MRKIFFLKNHVQAFIPIIGLMLGSYFPTLYAQETGIDFSKAYVITEGSTVDHVRLGGLKPTWMNDFFYVDFLLLPDFSMSVSGVMQEVSPREQLEQRLRNTTWSGTYEVHDKEYPTQLSLMAVQNGYIGGEIIHSPDTNGQGGYLNVRVAGDIILQYFIGGKYTDEDALSNKVIESLPQNTSVRYIIRLKRMRVLEFINGDNNSTWSSNREYRLFLENGVLSGTVAVPAERYGDSEDTSEYGSVSLTQ